MRYDSLQCKYYPRKQIEKYEKNSSYIALGFFDGVHLGHQLLLKKCVEEAKKANAVSTVVLLEPHPVKLINNINNFSLLTTLTERIKLIRNIGIEQVIVLKFNEELKKISAEDFILEILLKKFNMGAVFVGYNYHFGYQKKGDSKLLELLSEKYNFRNYILEPVKTNEGITISSTAIKSFLRKGQIAEANRLLGYSYQISGVVIHGDQRGRGVLSFPTVNLNISKDKLIPQNGVYIAFITAKGRNYQGLVNIGIRPTFHEIADSEVSKPLLEAHIFNFDQDIYQKKVIVSLLKKIRDEKKYHSSEELAQQIAQDKLTAEVFFRDKNNFIVDNLNN